PRHGVTADQTRGNRVVAAIGFLQQQDELIDRLPAGELAAAEPANDVVDVAAADVNVPADENEAIEGDVCDLSRFGVKDDRTDRLAPPRKFFRAGGVTRRPPRDARRRRDHLAAARTIGER